MILNSRSRQIVQRDFTIGSHQSGISGRYPVPKNGLVGEWDLNGDALDSSGFGNNGTATNVTYIGTDIGYQGQTGVFNGTNAYVQIPDNGSLDLTSEYHTSFWVRYTSLPTSGNVYQHYYKFNSGVAWGGYDCIIYNNAGTYQIYVTHTPNGAGVSYFWNWSTPVANTWYNIQISYYSSTLSLYINNVLISSQSATQAPTAGTGVLSIGRDTTGIRYLNGNIQQLRIFNRALSNKEVNYLYMEGLKLLH